MDTNKMKIFQPLEINGMVLKNRIGIGPFGNHPAAPDGNPNERTARFYEPLARGGAGLITMGIVQSTKRKSNWFGGAAGAIGMPLMDDDSLIPAWRMLNDLLHSYGTKTTVQIGPFGNQSLAPMSDIAEDNKKYAYMTNYGKDELPGPYEPRTHEQLLDYIAEIGEAAARVKACGFDCVQIHAAHSSGLLFAGSLDPFFNNRDDEFGGSPENRLRFVVEAVKAVRKAVGPDYPILIRINGDDLKGELGNRIDDVVRDYIPALEAAGVDCFDVSAGGPLYEMDGPEPALYIPRASWLHLSAAVKKATKLPVIGVGRLTTIEMGEKYLQDGSADIVYFARLGMSDPDFPNKYLAGETRPEETRQCIGCLAVGCAPCAISFEREDIRNPDRNFVPVAKAEKTKKVLVIGGGVGGMEAARIAALRGHKVTLLEKSGELGGTVGTLALTKMLGEFRNIIEYQADQLAKLGVDVRVCCEATAEKVKALAPDTVILATGADMILSPKVEGAPMVMTHTEALRRRREFRSYGQWKKRVLIYGLTAAEFALDLAEEGAQVTLMGPGGETSLAAEGWMGRERKHFLRRKLTDKNYIRRYPEQLRVYNPEVLYHVDLLGVSEGQVEILYHGGKRLMPYDVLIVSMQRKKNDELFEQLVSRCPEVYKIGDCDKIGNIHEAIVAANDVAMKI
jgi:2,4-dienoyl-CoA reductase-like NADH-dependent reductase (Old Yellow Enzyme family)/thioredoxin reductase